MYVVIEAGLGLSDELSKSETSLLDLTSIICKPFSKLNLSLTPTADIWVDAS